MAPKFLMSDLLIDKDFACCIILGFCAISSFLYHVPINETSEVATAKNIFSLIPECTCALSSKLTALIFSRTIVRNALSPVQITGFRKLFANI